MSEGWFWANVGSTEMDLEKRDKGNWGVWWL